jgi:hypothetical protein
MFAMNPVISSNRYRLFVSQGEGHTWVCLEDMAFLVDGEPLNDLICERRLDDIRPLARLITTI